VAQALLRAADFLMGEAEALRWTVPCVSPNFVSNPGILQNPGFLRCSSAAPAVADRVGLLGDYERHKTRCAHDTMQLETAARYTIAS